MPNMLWIIWITVFAAVSLLTYGVVTLWSKRSRVKDLLDNPGPGTVAATLLRAEAEQHPFRYWLSFLMRYNSPWTPGFHFQEKRGRRGD